VRTVVIKEFLFLQHNRRPSGRVLSPYCFQAIVKSGICLYDVIKIEGSILLFGW